MADLRALVVGGALLTAVTSSMVGCAASAQTAADTRTGVSATIRPGDDFYGYANGEWIAATPVPEGAARLDTTSMLRAKNARRVQGLIADAAAHPSHSRIARMVGDYYATLSDTNAIESRGLAPLSGDLAAIAAITDRRALATYLGRTLRLDDGANQQTESLWGVWVHQGFHDADHYAAHIVQGGLGMPEPQDYLDPSPERAAHRTLYLAHVANVLRAAGFDQPEARAQRVLDLEIAIAQTHASRADTDDVFKTDNTWRRADFSTNAPGLDWDAFFSASSLTDAPIFVVWQPQAVIGGARLAVEQSLETWKDYLSFHLIEHYAAVLPHAIGDERSAFEARLAGGEPSPVERQQQAFALTGGALGDAIGQLYVERYFSAHARAAAIAMVENIRTAFRARLANVNWMAPGTRAAALSKLASLRVGLGYPEHWVDYSDLTIVRGDALGNLQRVEAFMYHHELAKFTQRVDPDEWPSQLHPQMAAAVLNISPNTMQFGAGLLQPPYFDADGDAASNYGSAGAGIAHEINHSFDSVSNLYDAQGRLAPWWTPGDLTRYRAAAAPLAAQLSNCCPRPDLCAHGEQVLGESAADLIGLQVAHDAYVLSLHGRRDRIINRLTGEQRFFIAFAQRWRRQQSDAAQRQQVENDNHALPECRSDLVRNVDAWAQAFNVSPGDRLYVEPATRIHIW